MQQRVMYKRQAPFEIQKAIKRLNEIKQRDDLDQKIYQESFELINRIKENPDYYTNSIFNFEITQKIIKNVNHFIKLEDISYGFRKALNIIYYYENTVPKYIQDPEILKTIA